MGQREYSTRYRNRLTVERAFLVRKFRFDPYVSAEFFYDISKSSWNQEQYAAGVQLPYRRILMVDLYYLRQNCDTCNPEHLNVFGLTVNVYFGSGESERAPSRAISEAARLRRRPSAARRRES